jgi:rare lipoprotein A
MKNLIIILLSITALVMASCSSAVKYTNSEVAPKNVKVGDKFIGVASYYADKLYGQLTASGESYDLEKFTAAHRSIPFGTKVLVRNLLNNRTVEVKINDRGPFVEGRMIDISKAAADKLDMIGQKPPQVEITILEMPGK